jgi:hypothetical protein
MKIPYNQGPILVHGSEERVEGRWVDSKSIHNIDEAQSSSLEQTNQREGSVRRLAGASTPLWRYYWSEGFVWIATIVRTRRKFEKNSCSATKMSSHGKTMIYVESIEASSNIPSMFIPI